jgi:cell division protein FtsB
MSPAQVQPPFWRRHLLPILGLAFLALAIHDVFGAHGYLAMRRTETEIDQLRGQIQQLSRENQSLSQEVTALKTDPKAIEKIAREDMGLVRPGEMIFKLPPDAAAKPKPKK